jgi:hypothetical protein
MFISSLAVFYSGGRFAIIATSRDAQAMYVVSSNTALGAQRRKYPSTLPVTGMNAQKNAPITLTDPAPDAGVR